VGNGETILVVDDVEEQRAIATSILEKMGYRATAVPGGEEAVTYLETNPVDLVVLDMIMEPGIDGLETFRRIRKVKPGQKAIIASGFSETYRVREAQQIGAGKYVKKPYTVEKLCLAIQETLRE
jgi:CheY-like chemotaxis protein